MHFVLWLLITLFLFLLSLLIAYLIEKAGERSVHVGTLSRLEVELRSAEASGDLKEILRVVNQIRIYIIDEKLDIASTFDAKIAATAKSLLRLADRIVKEASAE
jgi:hypothetical protein